MSKNTISVIDLFAGPGGLGEGFESFQGANGRNRFKIGLSIECDAFAHRTLELRSFYRQFKYTDLPSEYYLYVRGQISRKELFDLYPIEASEAQRIAAKIRLGTEDSGLVMAKVNEALAQNKPWVLIGGPPCQAYSLVGRSRRSGECRIKFESDEKQQLYKQYLKILRDHRPAVFVMENVKGILSAKLGGSRIFSKICDDLADEGYELYGLNGKPSKSRNTSGEEVWDPSAFLVRAEEHGIPQARHRVFILGVQTGCVQRRIDASMIRLKRKPLISVEEIIGDMPPVWSSLSSDKSNTAAWCKARERGLTKAGYKLRSSLEMPENKNGSRYIRCAMPDAFNKKWYQDPRLRGVLNHESRSHIADDVSRYAFAAAYAPLHGYSPTIHDFPKSLLPAHKNVHLEGKTIPFADRFRVQMYGGPSTTVTSHISKDGHYYIHPDPEQARSLTVREAARLQTFPDNYFFEGGRTQQYHQVGNAVPPLLALQIAEIVDSLL